MTSLDKNNISRREFLARTIKAASALTVIGGTSYILYDNKGPGPDEGKVDLVKLNNFSVPAISGRTVCVVKGSDRTKSLLKSIEMLGGIGRFVKKGDRVLIKPNVAFASSPELCATTNPILISAITSLCFKAGASRVTVADNPINSPESCFLLSGIEEAARSSGAEIILPRPEYFRKTTLAGGKLIREYPVFYTPLSEADKIIGIAPLKSHHRSGASMTMKNWYGLLGGRRNIFHQDIHTIIAELAALIKPTLVILDGIDIMMTNGPTGGSLSDLKKGNTLIASCDHVAADSIGCSLLGKRPQDLPFIFRAEQMGAGTSDFKSLGPIFTEAG